MASRQPRCAYGVGVVVALLAVLGAWPAAAQRTASARSSVVRSRVARVPRALRRGAAPCVATGLRRCAGPATPRTDARPGLRAADLSSRLDRAALRRASGEASEETFDTRWHGSLASPSAFLRAFPAAFLADLRDVAADAPGGRGVVFGDLHPDNFGFVREGGATRYVFNDLDDGGEGQVALDAVRYFTALRLWGFGVAVVSDALDAYARDLTRPAALDPTRLPRGVRAPSWRRSARRALADVTRGDRFVLGAQTRLDAAPADVRAAITDELTRGAGPLHRYAVLDVARRQRDHGGSAGLERYWVLAERDGERALIEFKQAAPPAVEQLVPPGQGALSMDARLDVLKRRFWGVRASHDHVYATILGRRFLVRDRLRMDNVRVGRLEPDDAPRLLRAQVRLIAAVHAPAWGATSPGEARAWLDASSRVLAARWQEAWQRAQRDAPASAE